MGNMTIEELNCFFAAIGCKYFTFQIIDEWKLELTVPEIFIPITIEFVKLRVSGIFEVKVLPYK